MFDFHLIRPEYLLALVVLIPTVVALWYTGYKIRVKARRAYGEEKLIGRFTKPLRLASEAAVLTGWVAVVTLLTVAAAGPVTPAAPTNVKAGTLEVIAVVDVSKSMAPEDYRTVMPPKNGIDPTMVPGAYGSRLDMTKLVLSRQVMPAIQGNRLGIVNYSGNGFNQAPLTDDFTSLKWVMDNWMKIGAAPGGGSDYGEGLKEAVKMFKAEKLTDKQRVIILFSDGGFDGEAENLEKVLEDMRQLNVKLIIVGVGSTTPSPVPLYSRDGQLTGYLQKDGQVQTSALDETALTSLATLTGGEYVRLQADGKLDIQWASTLGGTRAEKRENHVYYYPMGVAVLLLGFLFLRGLAPRKDLI